MADAATYHSDVFINALLCADQKVEMFELASYRSAGRLARQLGNGTVAMICQGILDEVVAADEKLSAIGMLGERSTAAIV